MQTHLLKKQIAIVTIIIGISFCSSANAQIIYHPGGFNIDCFLSGTDSFTVKMNSASTGDFLFTVMCIDLPYGGAGFAQEHVDSGNFFTLIPLMANDTIGPNLSWTNTTSCLCWTNGWQNNVSGFLGVKFLINGEYYYGWIQLEAENSGGNNPSAYCSSTGWAYYNESGHSIPAGASSVTGISSFENEIQLSVYPNPISQLAIISFSIVRPAHISLKIFDVQGRLIRTVVDENVKTGDHVFTWDSRDENGSEVSDGIYVIQLSAAENSETIRLEVAR